MPDSDRRQVRGLLDSTNETLKASKYVCYVYSSIYSWLFQSFSSYWRLDYLNSSENLSPKLKAMVPANIMAIATSPSCRARSACLRSGSMIADPFQCLSIRSVSANQLVLDQKIISLRIILQISFGK